MGLLSRSVLILLLLHIACKAEADILSTSTQVDNTVLADILGRLSAIEETLTWQYRSPEAVIKTLLEERTLSSEKSIQRDIIRAITQSRYPVAEEKMLELGDPAAVAGIVRDVYSNSDYNFQLLLNLTRSLTTTSLKSQILLNLHDEATKNDQISTLNLITLTKALSEKGQGYQFDRLVSGFVFNKLLDRITTSTIDVLVDALKSKESYQDNAEVKALSAGIADWPDVSKKVMTEVVAEAFETVDNKKILEAVSSHSDAAQALAGVDALIERLKDENPFEVSTFLDIASRLSEVMSRGNEQDSERALEVKNKIPGCIGNLSSLAEVCIWNTKHDSFLNSSESIFHEDKRNIFTTPRWENNTTPADARWRFKLTGERLFFESVAYPREMFHAAKDSEGYHRLTGLIPEEDDLDEKFAWILEPYGDSCFLKSSAMNEYLYASRFKVDDTEDRFVLLKSEKDDPLEGGISEFLWQMRSC